MVNTIVIDINTEQTEIFSNLLGKVGLKLKSFIVDCQNIFG